ncbi:DUF5694 domain-containing protein [Cytophagaceae bacterium DM2B3-1]|uniref:DUF5694 domain-containing protein n=1 Tax=Xanthocytophaga flava TaxID=3048013 RepID=A0ABT7CWL1_9BACT|nr:DUF5694 domain-containing protein [Xanthocytophaga flavus]MDJ1498117.1 DUF5694 domain-containing protein [Xanthocytophaga flavus]
MLSLKLYIGYWLIALILIAILPAQAQQPKTDILLLGSDHLAQIYKKDNPNTDVLTPSRQKELAEVVRTINAYHPDLILVERLPEEQTELDSLYTLYQQNKLDIAGMDGGRGEVYQLAFPLAKKANLKKIYGVNAPGGTSQSILDNGEHIELYKQATTELRKVVGEKYTALGNNSLSLKDYMIFLNKPECYNLIYRLRYMVPARVTNGKFKNPDAMVDTAFVNPKYIGAELISVFKNRDYKIYSNIVTTQMQTHAKRILVIIGVAHIGSLKSIFRDDIEFTLVDADKYLK